MAEMRRFGPLDALLLLLVLGIAGGLRAGYLMSCADGSRSEGPLRVQDVRPPLSDFAAPEEMRGYPRPNELDALIHNVEHNRSFACLAPFANAEEQTAHISPGYPWLVGHLAQLTTQMGRDLDSTVRWFQMALGTLTAALYYLFARRAFRSLLVGTLAGLFAACNPFWIISTATIDDGVLATFGLASCIFLAGQAGEKGGAFSSLLLGLMLGGTALVRAALLPFAFVALIWYLIRSRSLPGSWLCGLLSLLGFLTALAPWTVRNYQVFNEPVTIVTSTCLHLWVGNNPRATGGPATPAMLETLPAAELRKITGQHERYVSLGKDVAEEIRTQPIPTMQRRLYALAAFFVGDRWLKDGALAEWTPPEESQKPPPAWLERAYPGTLQAVVLVMLLLAFLGWRWSYGLRWESVPAALAMMWVPLPYILGHAEAMSGPRLPLDGVLLCFAAFALVALVPGLNSNLLDPPDTSRLPEEQPGG